MIMSISEFIQSGKFSPIADIGSSLDTISNFVYLLLHPSLILKGLWDYTVIYSFWICMFIALGSAIFYAIGFKKCGKYVPCSIIVYTLIKSIASAF